MCDLVIRAAEKVDLDMIHEFVCGLEAQEFDKEALRVMFQACLENDNHIYLIAEVDGMPIG